MKTKILVSLSQDDASIQIFYANGDFVSKQVDPADLVAALEAVPSLPEIDPQYQGESDECEDSILDCSDDADALASAGHGTDEDYGVWELADTYEPVEDY